MQKLDWVDALRGYAILGVLSVHSLLEDNSVFLAKFWALGHKGVQLFFIVSAFTLMLSYSRRKEEKLATDNFFIRRFLRIAPMFYVALVYYLIQDRNLAYPASYWQNASPSNIIAHIFMLNGTSPHWINSIVPGGWSVGVEVLFYLACPFLFARITDIKKAFIYYVATLILGQLLYWFLAANPLIADTEKWSLFLYYYLPSQLFVFMLGFIAFFTTQLQIKAAAKYIGTLLAISVAAYGAWYFMPNKDFKLLNNNLMAVSFVIVVNILARFKFNVIVNPVVKFIGKISFSLYLSHFAALHFLNVFALNNLTSNATQNFCIRFALVLSIATAISVLTYKFIEVPFQDIARNVIKRRTAAKG